MKEVVLITGIAGFLGGHIGRDMIERGYDVVGIDNMIGGSYANVPSGAYFYNADCRNLSDIEHIFQGHKPKYLIHCAATAHEGLSVFSPCEITSNIYHASVVVFTAAIKAGVRRIINCSSMARYGNGKPPFDEGALPVPKDPYGCAKLCSEWTLACLAEAHGFEFINCVPHNIIGEGQKYDDPFRNVASIMINRMAQGKQPIIYGDGSQVRCFSYVKDILPLFHKMMVSSECVGETINIGPDSGEVTILQLAELIADVMGFNLNPIFMPGRPQEVHHATCSAEKSRKLLGYETKYTLREAIEAMVPPIVNNPLEFNYHLPIEIVSERTPQTWTKKLI